MSQSAPVDPASGDADELSRQPGEGPQDPEPPTELELLALRDGLPPVVETEEGLAAAIADLAHGHGAVAIDAERASGYRYSARAYLIQLRRAGSTTWLVDPIAFDGLAPLQEVLAGPEWILHAASQDLACLREVGLEPSSLFDTELAARLLGYPRVGLATLVETLCERRMRKEHSAADWSRRPLPSSWLEYAALDVEVLVEIRDRLSSELIAAGKESWARQEFETVLAQRPTARIDPWRRTSGMHKARGRRAVAAVRELWLVRDEIATRRDVTPGRVLPDSAIVVAASALPTDRGQLLSLRGFHGRGADRYAARWVQAIRTALELPEGDLPPATLRSDAPPPPRAWAERNPEAAARLTTARASLAALSAAQEVPVENLLTPDVVRRVLWAPPNSREPVALDAALTDQLAAFGARPWQVELVRPLLREAILDPTPLSQATDSARPPTRGSESMSAG